MGDFGVVAFLNVILGRIVGKTLDELYYAIKEWIWNNIFGKKTKKQKLEEERKQKREAINNIEDKMGKLEEKNQTVKELREEVEDKREEVSTYDRLVDSLKRKGVSREKLVEEFDDPIPVIILSYTHQKDQSSDEDKFILNKLKEEYNLKFLGGGSKAIPPEDVPDYVKNRETLEKWFEEEIYESKDERSALIRFAVICDLKKDVYSRDDFEWDSDYGSAILDELNVESVFGEEDLLELIDDASKTKVSEVIESGDIAFFASRFITEDELDEIIEHQDSIEESLNNPNLSELASGDVIDDLAQSLDAHISKPRKVSEGIVEEAKIWEEQLNS